MSMSARLSLIGTLLLGGAVAANAADLYEPPVVEAPPPVVYEQPETGNWYIRGDVDYHWSDMRGANYITYGCCVPTPGNPSFTETKLKGSWSLGGGIGYQMNRYLRTDLTADYWFKSDFEGSTTGTCGGAVCTSTDVSEFSALLLLANAYADLGTYNGVTPYVGAGIGGAHVKWGDLRNTIPGGTTVHEGASEWRFAWALMAGASYCITPNLQADVGYRFSRIEGGRMFEYAPVAGPGFDEGINTHEVRAGLRWNFGGGNANCAPVEVAYQPEPVPVYK